MNFQELRNSNFIKLGKLYFDFDNSVAEYDASTQCRYDIIEFTENKIDNLLTELDVFYDWGPKRPMPVSLYRAISQESSTEWRRTILEQYKEVNKCVRDIQAEPKWAFLYVLSPGQRAAAHIHMSDIKRTLTFVYSYREFDTDRKSKLIIYEGQDMKNVVRETAKHYEYLSNKTIISMSDNPMHSSECYGEWQFFWIFDFTEYVDFSDDVYSRFAKMEIR